MTKLTFSYTKSDRKKFEGMKIVTPLIFVFAVAVWLVSHTEAGPPGDAFDGVLNATYMIEKQEVHLIDGRAEVQAAPGSAAKITTTVFGKPVFGDLDGDGHDDAVLFLMHDPGGSGTFCYIAAAIAKNGIYQGTLAVLLGDRIAPESLEIRNGMVVVHYADRRPDEPMATSPSVGKTKYFRIKSGQLVETRRNKADRTGREGN